MKFIMRVAEWHYRDSLSGSAVLVANLNRTLSIPNPGGACLQDQRAGRLGSATATCVSCTTDTRPAVLNVINKIDVNRSFTGQP